MKILIIEDEPSLHEIMRSFLEKERYVVESAYTYSDALDKVSSYDYDCILLDIMLPDGNGLLLLRHLRQLHKHDNVMIISARDSIEDKVEGLELGADDYLAKPFHLAELNARIKSVLRRKVFGGENKLAVGNAVLDPDNHTVFVDGRQVELTRKEYDIFNYFAGRADMLIEKTALAEGVWGDYIDQADNFDFIYAQVKNLRRKLRDAGADVEIKSVYGFGYKLVTRP